MTGPVAYTGARLFDGARMLEDHALVVKAGTIRAVVPQAELPGGMARAPLDGGVLAPGYVDLQVNGGGGVMFNDAPTVDTLATMAEAHGHLGATAILPTLITDTRDITRAAIEAAVAATRAGVAGIAGLHLEGPHLSLARKGAHDPALIRPMEDDDLDALVAAARRLPVLKVTLAPESVTPSQIGALSRAGILVSLGHSDCTLAAAEAAVAAGARCVTHLFNAMSQLGNREPGLVGAAVSLPGLSAGLIADLIHVHPTTLRMALAAKAGPGRIFLVSDAMATAGSAIDGFTLNGRRITRQGGRLTLEDGTLAGADLDLTTALRNLVSLGVELDAALAMATALPAQLIGQDGRLGALAPGRTADFLHLTPALTLGGVWRAGAALRPQTASATAT